MARWYRIPVVRQIGHALVYFPIRGLLGLLTWLPGPLLRPTCLGLGKLAYRVDRRHARIARENLQRAFPDRSPEECSQLVSRVYRHFSLMAQDTVLLWRSRGEDVLAKFFDEPDVSVLHALKEEGRGVIMVTGHMGNWEMAGSALATTFQVNGISREFRNPHIRRGMFRVRRAFGQKILFPHHGYDPMIECLKQNESLAVLPDKHLNSSRIPVEFFGRYVKAPSGPALLSLRSGAPILTGGAFRLGETTRFRLECEEVIRPDRKANFKAEIQRLTQAWTSSLETLIRRYPEQWIWFHNRWKKAFTQEQATFRPSHGARAAPES